MNRLMKAADNHKPLFLSVFLFLGLVACCLYWYAVNDSKVLLLLSLSSAVMAFVLLYAFLSGRVNFDANLLRSFGITLFFFMPCVCFCLPSFLGSR